jgi:hypothetical protein
MMHIAFRNFGHDECVDVNVLPSRVGYDYQFLTSV